MNQATTAALARWGVLPLRIVVAAVFLMHGGTNLFVWGLSGTTAGMTQMGIPLPGLAAVVVTFVELLGGLAILTGCFTRWAGLLLAIDMTVAILKVRLSAGFLGGYELELTLLGAALTLAAVGAGGVSVDRLLERGKAASVAA
jgi:putative oxidoreductase